MHIPRSSEHCLKEPGLPGRLDSVGKLALMAKVQDESGHAQLLYSAAETLGKSREDQINDLINGKSKYSNVFNYPAVTWADTAVIAWLIDAGAIVNQTINSKGSYGPYHRALERICYEESFHLKLWP